MTLEQVSLRVDTRLLHEIDDIAKADYKRRSDIIRDALVSYIKRELEIRHLKELATKQFLEGKLGFDDFARIVGFETATQIKTGKETLEESISRAKSDSKKDAKSKRSS